MNFVVYLSFYNRNFVYVQKLVQKKQLLFGSRIHIDITKRLCENPYLFQHEKEQLIYQNASLLNL